MIYKRTLIGFSFVVIIAGLIGLVKSANPPKNETLPTSTYQNAKPELISTIPSCYYKIADKVFCDGKTLSNADVSTFKVIDSEFAKDKEQVYTRGVVIDGVDASTFESAENIGFFVQHHKLYKDKNHTYVTNYYGNGKLSALPFDPNSAKNLGSYYIKSNDGIYYVLADINKILGADPDTFQVVVDDIAKDKNHIYIKGKIIEGPDPVTFGFATSSESVIFSRLFFDQNRNYYLGYPWDRMLPLPIDLKSAKRAGSYVIDKNAVYFWGDELKEVQAADRTSFRTLGLCYSVETSHGSYAADKNHVYVGSTVLDNVNPNDFTLLAEIPSGGDYEVPFTFYVWKDQNNAFVHCGVKIKEADIASLEFKDGQVQDKNNYYDFHTGGGYYVKQKVPQLKIIKMHVKS